MAEINGVQPSVIDEGGEMQGELHVFLDASSGPGVCVYVDWMVSNLRCCGRVLEMFVRPPRMVEYRLATSRSPEAILYEQMGCMNILLI